MFEKKVVVVWDTKEEKLIGVYTKNNKRLEEIMESATEKLKTSRYSFIETKLNNKHADI